MREGRNFTVLEFVEKIFPKIQSLVLAHGRRVGWRNEEGEEEQLGLRECFSVVILILLQTFMHVKCERSGGKPGENRREILVNITYMIQ